MSLILTHISKFGILQVADSALTTKTAGGLADSRDADKLFDIADQTAVVAVAGTYAVGLKSMDNWMRDCIANHQLLPDLSTFATALKDALTAGATGNQAHIMHLTGYGPKPAVGTIPQFWHVRNMTGIDDQTGDYTGRSSVYTASEDFPTRDLPNGDWEEFKKQMAEQVYVNGHVYGRIAFNFGFQALAKLDSELITRSKGNLRSPQSIDEMKDRVVRRFDLVSDVYSRNTYGARVIGGPTQIRKLPIP